MFACSPRKRLTFHRGFTLAELLISLAILGVIATFTIPKILTAQQDSSNKAKAKEAAAMISGAFLQAQTAGTLSALTTSSDLTPYMNYVGIESTTMIDAHVGATFDNCAAVVSYTCLKLHQGGILSTSRTLSFGGTSTINAIRFTYDPDGVYSGSTADSPGKSVQFLLYYNGALNTRGQTKPGSTDSLGGLASGPFDPSWFSW